MRDDTHVHVADDSDSDSDSEGSSNEYYPEDWEEESLEFTNQVIYQVPG